MGQFRNEKLLKSIGLSFKNIREKQGLTQEQVFNDTGIHVGRVETWKTNLSISTIDQLCRYYGLKLNEFFDQL